MELLKNLLIHQKQGYAFYFKHQKQLIQQVNGFNNINNQDVKINFDTNFRLASVSKQFIAYGIILLVEEQKLSFDTKIIDIYPTLPNYFQQITIRNLLNHTSGIYDYEDIINDEKYNKLSNWQIHDQDIIPFLKTTSTTYFKPSTDYRYSNTAFILLGLIIEKISQMSIDKYLKEKIFLPLKMDHTYVNYEGITKINNRAYGHILKDHSLVMKDQYWCSATIGDGGIYSNIHDLQKWLLHLENNYEYLLKTMFKTTIIGDKDICYGMGMRVINFHQHQILYHTGDTIGTNTLILFSKDLDLECIFLTNLGEIDTEILKNNILSYLEKE